MKKLSLFFVALTIAMVSCESEIEKSTVVEPTVVTKSIKEITESTAKVVGLVTADGGAEVTERGVCWNTDGIPTVLDYRVKDAEVGIGTFTSSLSDLEVNTTYYVRAYATNAVGTSYGEEMSFTTEKIESPESPESPENPETQIIKFQDENAKLICILHWDEDEDGELSYEEAAAVTNLGTAFKDSRILSFTELKYFTSLTNIANDEFEGCVSLVKISLPEQITTIGENAFSGCTNLQKIVIPDSVTEIGWGAFQECTSLASVTMGNKVTSIGSSAFEECNSLTSITIPESVTSIEDNTFLFCSKLASVTIGNSVTSIGEDAFRSCDSLTSITIPESVNRIGRFAFIECRSLKEVYCKSTVPPTADVDYMGQWYAFDTGNESTKIYVPHESLNAYKTAKGWKFYAYDIVGYDFETGEITQPSINLGVCGTFTNWGQDGILDIEMEYLEHRNLYVAYGIELTTDDRFKLRSNNEWNGRYNIGASYYGYVAYPNCLTEVINSLDSQDIFVAESGTYDIYINLDTMELYFMVEGLDIFEE